MSGRCDYKNGVTCARRSGAPSLWPPRAAMAVTTAIVTRKEMRCVEIQTYNAPVVSGVVD
ncbi:hypothetical protein EMIT0158MI4_120037 [Burkholderia ambifaria]